MLFNLRSWTRLSGLDFRLRAKSAKGSLVTDREAAWGHCYDCMPVAARKGDRAAAECSMRMRFAIILMPLA